MDSVRQRSPCWQIAALAVLAAEWIVLSIPLVLGCGDAEAFFLSTFQGYSRSAHPYISLSHTLLQLWMAHCGLLVFGIAAVTLRKTDLFTVLMIGPLLALLIAVVSLQWSDPDWLIFTGICLVGWLVGIVSGGVYCLWKLCVR